MLFAFCRDFINHQRSGIKFEQQFPFTITSNTLTDQNGDKYFTSPTTDLQGIALKFDIQFDKDVIFYIKEIQSNNDRITTNIAINLNKQISKPPIYKQIKKKIIKYNKVFQKSGQKLKLNQIKEQSIVQPQQESTTITQNELTYITYLEKLSTNISRKYVIEYLKEHKIKNERVLNFIYRPLVIERELFNINSLNL